MDSVYSGTPLMSLRRPDHRRELSNFMSTPKIFCLLFSHPPSTTETGPRSRDIPSDLDPVLIWMILRLPQCLRRRLYSGSDISWFVRDRVSSMVYFWQGEKGETGLVKSLIVVREGHRLSRSWKEGSGLFYWKERRTHGQGWTIGSRPWDRTRGRTIGRV